VEGGQYLSALLIQLLVGREYPHLEFPHRLGVPYEDRPPGVQDFVLEDRAHQMQIDQIDRAFHQPFQGHRQGEKARSLAAMVA